MSCASRTGKFSINVYENMMSGLGVEVTVKEQQGLETH